MKTTMQMTWLELAKTVDPNLTDEQADYLLGNKTCLGFGSLRLVYRQLRGAIRAFRNGINTCDLCPNKVGRGTYTCDSCERALYKVRQERPRDELDAQIAAAGGKRK